MADFSGIGTFGQGALQGYQTGLSNYATIDQIIRANEADKRAKQAQALQSLLHGTQLAQANPDIAEQAMRNPAYGLQPEEIGPGIEAERRTRAATAKLNAAIQSGSLESVMDDPEVGQVIGKNIKVYAPIIKEMNDRRTVDRIIGNPKLTPQQKAQALIQAGVKVDFGMFQTGFPEVERASAAAKAAGTAEGALPFVGPTAQAKAAGTAEGALPYVGPTAQAKKQGEINAELSPDVTNTNVPLGRTSAGRLAQERETPAQRERRLRPPASQEIGPKDISASLSRINSAATAAVTKQLGHIPKDTWVNFNQAEQQQIVQYLTNQQALALAENDPVAKGQIKEMPRPAAMDKFEAKAQEGGFWDSITSYLFGGNSTSQPAVTSAPAPRTLRQPAPPAQGGWGKAEVVR